MSERFGDLRAAIARRSFSDTCAAIERWPEDDPELHELALPYAREHLATWPGLRHAPDRWCDALYAGERPPWSSLADSYAYRSRAFRDGRHHGSFEEPATSLASVLSAHDETLRSLSLSDADLTHESWHALTYALHLTGLERLDLFDVLLHADALRALARAELVPRLQELSLGGVSNSPPDRALVEMLLGSVAWDPLVSLTLGGLTFRSAAPMPSLRSLSLVACSPSTQALSSLMNSSLKRVSFNHCVSFGEAEARQIAWADTPALRSLVMTRCEIGAPEVDALLSGRHVRRVKHLDLSGAAYVMEGGASQLARAVARACGSLELLGLSDCRLGDDAVDALAQSSSAATLRHLILSRNPLSDRALLVLTSGAFPALQTLTLADTGVRGISEVLRGIERGGLPSLEALTLSAAQLDPDHAMSDAVAMMREVGVRLDLGVGFMRPRRSRPS